MTYILLNVVQTTIIGHEGSNFLAVLDKLHPGTLTDSRIGLFGLNTTEATKNNGQGFLDYKYR
jgi:hypothetical protein